MAKPGKAVPDRYHTITAAIVVEGAAKAIDFYKAAFGAEELSRAPMPDGRLMHAEIKIGNSVVMITDDFPDWCGGVSHSPKSLKGSPVTLHLYVEDADKLFARATAAGATATTPMMDAFWGDRYGKLRDPFGHEWSIATHKFDYTKEEMEQKFNEMMAEMSPKSQSARN